MDVSDIFASGLWFPIGIIIEDEGNIRKQSNVKKGRQGRHVIAIDGRRRRAYQIYSSGLEMTPLMGSPPCRRVSHGDASQYGKVTPADVLTVP